MQDREKIQMTQQAILGLNCSDSLTLHEWTERMKTEYGSPPFGNFIDIVGQAFIALHSQGYARQIVRDQSVNKSSKWQAILNSNRIFHIQQIGNERSITTLCHFTRVENLQSILQEGLLGRSLLEARGQQFLFNDHDRVDGHKEALCMSISFPNYQMFYSIREEKKAAQEANDSQWIVLLLDAKVLWELDCAFCQRNAAHNAVRRVPLEDRKKPKALKGMFEDFYNISHQDLQIPDPYLMHPKSASPTHPQAEVLVFDSIPVEYINTIHFYNETALQTWLKDNPGTYSQKFDSNRQYFKPRCNYKAWQN